MQFVDKSAENQKKEEEKNVTTILNVSNTVTKAQ